MGQPRNFLETFGGGYVLALVKDKDRHVQETQFASEIGEGIGILLHRVPDKDQGIEPSGARCLYAVAQHALDLALPAETGYRAHGIVQFRGAREPPARLAFLEAAIE